MTRITVAMAMIVIFFMTTEYLKAEPLGGWDTFPGPVAEPTTTKGGD